MGHPREAARTRGRANETQRQHHQITARELPARAGVKFDSRVVSADTSPPASRAGGT